MVEIKPFKGMRYNVDNFSSVITPPYDVIDEKEQKEFLSFSEYNMVRLLLEKEHAKVAKLLKEWQEKGVLKIDGENSIYIYSQTFKYNGDTFSRLGFISLIKLEDLGKGVLPHEKTLEKPFKDRLDLIENTKANLGSIFLLYDDKEKVIDSIIKEKVDGNDADMDFEDKFGIKHRLWKVSDEEFIAKLKEEMKQYQCIIADGHHRYKSVLAFKDENPELKDAKYTMCCCINSFNEGLFVLPIDRFVFGLENVDVDGVLSQLKKYFEIEEVMDVNDLIKKVDDTQVLVDKTVNLKNHVFGMYCYSNKKSYFLKLKNNDILDEYYPDDTDVYKKLDINILHKIIFEDILKISEEDQYRGVHIEYTKGSERALDKLEDEKYQFAFFINAPLMREIFLVARANETMPQKSTYFYPKVYSGLVINKINK